MAIKPTKLSMINDEITLTQYFPDPELKTREEHIRAIKENCDWELQVSREVSEAAPSTQDELLLLRLFNPQSIISAVSQKEFDGIGVDKNQY